MSRTLTTCLLAVAFVVTPLMAGQGGGGRHGPPAFVQAKKATKAQGKQNGHNKGGCDVAAPEDNEADEQGNGDNQGNHGKPVKASHHGAVAVCGTGGPQSTGKPVTDGAQPPKPAREGQAGCGFNRETPQQSTSGHGPANTNGQAADALPATPDAPPLDAPNAPATVLPPPASSSSSPPPPTSPSQPAAPKGNNGVGNGEDPAPPGDPKLNDGTGSTAGAPGANAAPDKTGKGSHTGKGRAK